MSLQLYDTIRRIAREELGGVRTAELGLVQQVHSHESASDTDNYACTVGLRDSGLVLPRVPVSTHVLGAAVVPLVGEMVLVQFLGGDINAPVITGRLYNDEDRPPENAAGQWVAHVPLGAADADAVHFELQSDGDRSLLLRLGSGLVLELKDDDPVVKIEVDGGAATLQIDRDGSIKIESAASMQVKAAELKLDADAISIEASGELNLKGATVNIN